MPRKYTRRNTIRGGKKGTENKGKKRKKENKGKKGKKKQLKDRRNLNYTIRQPSKKKYSFHAPRLLRKRPRYSLRRNMPTQSFKSMSFMDSSSYSNIMGKEDFKRKMRGHKNIEGQESGIEIDQDNNLIRIKRYPN
tara:strand:- start:1873 stop:2280 length:408 start_codon:yes stop_codon:yes gene_type:complete